MSEIVIKPFKEALLESMLRKMRLAQVLPIIEGFTNARVLDVGCGWEARLLREIEPYITKGVGIDFKAPEIQTNKLHTFSYFFEPKEMLAGGGGGGQIIYMGQIIYTMLIISSMMLHLITLRICPLQMAHLRL